MIENNERNIDATENAVKSNQETKRKRLTSIEWMAASNETINEIDSTEDDFAFVQRENKRRKIAISAIQAENKENIVELSLPLLPQCNDDDGTCNSNKALVRVTKPPTDGKNGMEPNKLRAKYEKIHTNTVQKMNAQAEQLRMEISTLRTALANEQNAVRVLRAQNDANFRKEKIQSLKLRGEKQMSAAHGSATPNRSMTPILTTSTVNNGQLIEQTTRIDRLLKEIDSLRETNKSLTEQVQKSSKADRQKIADIRQLKDGYEHRLNHTERASKMEINRLLEEIKSKKQTITLLQKANKTQSSLRMMEKNSMPKMRKKETEPCDNNPISSSNESNLNSNTKMTTTTNNAKTKQTIATHDSTTQTTCKEDLFAMPHEIRERIMNVQNELQYCKSKDLSGSDNDSALSSAPPSLSPQPGTQSNSPDVWQTQLLKDFKEHESLQKEYELIKEENQFLNCEITLAEEQIRELEKVLQMTRESNKHDELLERIHQLECKEAIILKESHELREQNELLEFRIIELEEGADKLLNSGSFNSKQDACTETDDTFDGSNGVMGSSCICNVTDQLPTDNVRKSLLAMSKHSCFDEQSRQCLLQVVQLLNNLESMSQDDNEFGLDDDHFNVVNEKLTRIHSPEQHSKLTPMSSLQSTASYRQYDRAVACIPPYISHPVVAADEIVCGTDNGRISNNGGHKLIAHKLSSSHSFSSSMNESGVFDGDLTMSSVAQIDATTQTQYDDIVDTTMSTAVDHSASEFIGCTNSDLCAEIQKLNKFRKKIEECASTMHSPSLDIGVLSPLSKIDETRLQYYRDRLEMLENKVAIYESSGDAQARQLAARLQHEIQLDAQVKQLQQRCDKLQSINRQIDEERCELEEIENDTRLQLQRLEIDLEMLQQRNSELEMSYETAQANVECLQESMNQSHDHWLATEADRNDLRTKWKLMNAFMPAILLFHAWKWQQYQMRSLCDHDHADHSAAPVTADAVNTEYIQTPECACQKEHICPDSERFIELVHREEELTATIAELNRAYNETLERADNLWAQMEREYKEKLARTQEDNTLLRSKIQQLEKRLKNDAHYAQERIAQLEDEENVLKRRLSKLNRISRDDADKFSALQSDFHSLNAEYEKLKSYVDGPVTEMLDKERKKVRTMEEEMRMASKMYNDLEQLHRTQMQLLKAKHEKCKKDLMTMEMQNSELKDEVVQLEHRIIELNQCRREDEDRIKLLAAEAREQQQQQERQQQLQHQQHMLQRPIKPLRIKHNSRNLAQELSSFGGGGGGAGSVGRSIGGGLNSINNLNYTSVYTLNSVASKINESIKNFEVNREPVRHQFE